MQLNYPYNVREVCPVMSGKCVQSWLQIRAGQKTMTHQNKHMSSQTSLSVRSFDGHHALSRCKSQDSCIPARDVGMGLLMEMWVCFVKFVFT